MFTNCGKFFLAANFGKGAGENLFFARKRFSLVTGRSKLILLLILDNYYGKIGVFKEEMG